MKKNGFIATSLIYSFFLIFVTLFLAIIADYLQNKVLLNNIEKGIKDDLNSTKSIEDFKIGDVLTFATDYIDKESNEINSGDIWIVAGINYIYDGTNSYNGSLSSSSLVLYSYNKFGSSCLSKQNIIDDLKINGSLNSTAINNILNKFAQNSSLYDSENKKYYSISSPSNCVKITDNDIDLSNCLESSVSTCRERKELFIGNSKFKYEDSVDNSSITITGVIQ